jgi:hypothetical protein
MSKLRINFNTTETIKGLAKKQAKKRKLNMREYMESLIIEDGQKNKS